MGERIGLREAVFALKCFAAAMLAYYLALKIGLTRPFWAVMTSYIVSQPLAGAVLSKAVFRAIGTVVGGLVAVLLVPNLVGTPELLSLGLALWLGLCVYISLLDRTPRAYVFLLAGYTASIIGFPSVNAPGAIFDTAALRVQEILLGIVCASLVHGVVFPQTVTELLLTRINAILADAERWTRDSLSIGGKPALDKERRRLALDINELHQLSIHLPFDTARLLPRVRTVRAFQDQLSMLLPLASAIEDRLEVLSAQDGGVPPEVDALVGDVRVWLDGQESATERPAIVGALIARAQALEPDLQGAIDFRTSLLLNLLVRLGDLIAAHRNCRDLSDQIRSPSRAAVTPGVVALLAESGRRVLHRDHGMALRTAAGTVATILIGSAFWIGTGWKDGAGAVLIAGVCCALFGSVDEPATVIRTFLIGTIIGIAIAAVYAFGILPRVTAFPVLVCALAPPLLIGGALMTNPKITLLITGAMLGFLGTVGLNDHYETDFVTFINGGMAQIVGAGFAVLCVQLFLTLGVTEGARRLIRAGWWDLATRANSTAPPDMHGWFSRMLDRIALLAPRLAARREDPGKPLFDALTDLRVGASIGELRMLRASGSAQVGAAITPVLQGVSQHYRNRLDAAETAPPADLLAGIDHAIFAIGQDEAVPVRRAGLLALVSLRRNLFPASLSVTPTA